MIEKSFEKLSLFELIPYENNPRINDKAVDDVIQSIMQCENLDPIEIDEDNIILAGHTRLKALQKMGYEETDVIRYTGLTDEQKRKYRLLSNKTSEKAEWDFAKLEEELSDLDFGDFDFGFDDFEALEADVEIEEDEVPEPSENTRVKTGDLWTLGDHRLICGDSTDQGIIHKLVSDRIDLLITDPPYNVDYQGGTKDRLTIMNDSMDDSKFRMFLADAFRSADKVMRPGAVFYIWHADSKGLEFRKACEDVGWTVRECLIWNKSQMVLGHMDYHYKHEPVLYGWKDGAAHTWASDRKQTTVIDWERPQRSELHPTMKPVGLFAYQIKNSTKSGDHVLDLFGGSGTTLVACQQLGRKSYLAELDPKYCDVIIERWENLTGKQAVLAERV